MKLSFTTPCRLLSAHLNVEPWNFELPQGFERLERASVLFDARHRFLKLAFQSQKATSKLLNDAFDATLVC
jgi:hypothetical protein